MTPSLFFVNLRFSGIGFRAYILKKAMSPLGVQEYIDMKSTKYPYEVNNEKNFSSTSLRNKAEEFYIHRSKPSGVIVDSDGTKSSKQNEPGYIKLLIIKVGKSAITAYPIPAKVNVYCPTDQQQQAENQPLLLTSDNLHLLTQVAAEIKSYKKPDPYKGSGIYLCERFETDQGEIYENEIINRKVIKKK